MARGILVNVTAGLDFSIGEYTEVGNLVGEFAADSATVVVGTVIDPEMSDEVRVTVVATGLGRNQQAQAAPAAQAQTQAQAAVSPQAQAQAAAERPAKVVDNTPRTADGRIDYGKLIAHQALAMLAMRSTRRKSRLTPRVISTYHLLTSPSRLRKRKRMRYGAFFFCCYNARRLILSIFMQMLKVG